ncbi:DM4/DM12 domain-containing protein Desiccate [Leptinotarsa decemlineata]|uniref:DM4/DM12 domain-containing protein Desiccate n=1 Tax=Leptinotarsa decemlineata TaxID=7539 RepID=UPI003D308459
MKSLFCLIVFLVNDALGSPKIRQPDDDGFEPNHRYYESDIPDFHTKFHNYSKPERKESRFGIIPIQATYGSSGSGMQYGTGNEVYTISPMKLDIGGIALGALIGLGAVLFLPKIAHLFGGHGGYRSLENEMSSVNELLARIDNSLQQNNIDSNSCIQRMICTYLNQAKTNINNGESNTLDEFAYAISNNTLLSEMLDGTAVKQAIEVGKSGDSSKCSKLFSQCPATRSIVLKVIENLLPA